jgi:lipopolysaccharide/colanic/teichoic acid biosynthesis glycosyltransferase
MLRRLADILLGSAALVVTSPLMMITAFAVSLDGAAVFFKQRRAGRMGSDFEILKFRSMRPHNLTTAELMTAHGQITSRHPDVTSVGRWIRRFKMDELPQLVNIIKGEMSIIGPRPTVPEQVKEYTAYELHRLDVRPGLTGWAQVNGGTALSWPDRILLDVWYIAHRSLWLDLRILLKTVGVLIRGEKPNLSALAKAKEFARETLRHSSTLHLADSKSRLVDREISEIPTARRALKEEL